MIGIYGSFWALCLLASLSAWADEGWLVDRYDPLIFDDNLTLAQVIDATLEHYPQAAMVEALRQEASALKRRSRSWIAGYPSIYLQWIDDRAFSDRGTVEIQTGYQLPVWMWGQREAGKQVAKEASASAEYVARALKQEVAGLVRDSLWNLALVQNRYELAKQVLDVSGQLVAAVQRRVELGDLARSDLLLAQSDLLEKKTALALAEAEVMHARKAYSNLTRLERAPRLFAEELSRQDAITEEHPVIAAANAVIERAQAEVEWTRKSKQGNQPSILIGTQHDRSSRRNSFNNESNLVLQVPIGGESYNAPFVAQANLALTQRMADRNTLMRQLEKAFHEARQNIDVDRAALAIADERRKIAETHLRMSRLAFETGEIQLIDFLKIQSGAQAAFREARERSILLQRDIAFYNQVVGIMP
jgi:cobalt-zinc-cadmium efflux system outer membrane protein